MLVERIPLDGAFKHFIVPKYYIFYTIQFK